MPACPAAASFGSAVHYKREYFLEYKGWGTGCHNSITFGFLKYSNQSILNSSLQLLNTFLSQNRHKSPPTFCHECFGHSEVLVVQSSSLCRIQWAQPSWFLGLWSKCNQVILWNRVKRTQNIHREGLNKGKIVFVCIYIFNIVMLSRGQIWGMETRSLVSIFSTATDCSVFLANLLISFPLFYPSAIKGWADLPSSALCGSIFWWNTARTKH